MTLPEFYQQNSRRLRHQFGRGDWEARRVVSFERFQRKAGPETMFHGLWSAVKSVSDPGFLLGSRLAPGGDRHGSVWTRNNI